MKLAGVRVFSSVSGRAWVVWLVGFTVFLGGCTQVGPKLVQAGRNDYNKVLARSEQEEQLLNPIPVNEFAVSNNNR